MNRISVRFRNINIVLFMLAFCVMAVSMFLAFSGIIRGLSADYAKRYAVSSANVLSANISGEIDVIANIAESYAVIGWMADEGNVQKKYLAHSVFAEVIDDLYDKNLYIGVEGTGNAYVVGRDEGADAFLPFSVLSETEPQDRWYFDCVSSGEKYQLNVGIDLVTERKRVFLNYNVVQNGETIGVLSTGLEFSHVVRELFARFEADTMRGLIVDGNGYVYMDSLMLSEHDQMQGPYQTHIDDELSNIGRYRYVTTVPIEFTDWSAIILYDPSASFNMSLFVPIFTVMLILLLLFAVSTSTLSYRLIFKPLEQLDRSLSMLKENNEKDIFGIDRNDEFGTLAKTIQDLFKKANHDALTGIYNRRFMENNLHDFMEFLSRSNGFLSVIMVDIDFFKYYNDTYGHDRGDECLREVAHAIAGSIPRSNDFAARYGGEEFLAVLPNTDEAGARVIAEKILENVRNLNIAHAKSSVAERVTVSVGVATGKVFYTQKWEEYVKRSDEALYMSKQGGRNMYTYLDMEQI